MNLRLSHCRDVLTDAGLDAVIVSDPADVRYLSGFRGDDTTLLVGHDVALICTDSRYWAEVREEVTGFELVKVLGPELLTETAAAVALRIGPDAILGFQGAKTTYADYRALRRRHRGRLRDVRDHVRRLRVVKDEGEVGVMRRAAALTDQALRAVVDRGLVGRTELEVAWSLRAEYHRLGAEGEAFPAIVATGDHGAHVHAVPGERSIARGDLVVIDTGAKFAGYCSDITRTYAAGESTEELSALYAVVLEAQLAGVGAVRAGAHGRDDVDAACRAVIDAAGYGECFGHGTGHGVGLEVHEPPHLGRSEGDPLEAGMVCTVEPGVYVEGLAGVRIEDTVLVTVGGCERLTTCPRGLQVID